MEHLLTYKCFLLPVSIIIIITFTFDLLQSSFDVLSYFSLSLKTLFCVKNNDFTLSTITDVWTPKINILKSTQTNHEQKNRQTQKIKA